MIALLVFGGFVLFVFFGKAAVTTEVTEPVIAGGAALTIMRTELVMEEAKVLMVDGKPVTIEINTPVTTTKTDTALYTTVLAAFGTLTAAVAGFYFGGRSAQSTAPPAAPPTGPPPGP